MLGSVDLEEDPDHLEWTEAEGKWLTGQTLRSKIGPQIVYGCLLCARATRVLDERHPTSTKTLTGCDGK
ncbi:unnamed protein product [Caenorhabditis nigoni]